MSNREKFGSAFFFCIFLLFFIVSSASIQARPEKLNFGLNVGPIFSSQWSTGEKPAGYENPTGQSGLSIGFFSNLTLGKRFSLQGEICMSDKGAKHNIIIAGFPFGPIDVTYTTDYLEIPLWLKFYVIKKEKFRIYTGAGGYIAFLTKGKYLFENEFIPSFTEDMEDIKKTDFGFLGNWGLEIKAAHFLFHLEYRYSMGFADISYPTGPGSPEIEFRHLSHVVLFGVSFAFL